MSIYFIDLGEAKSLCRSPRIYRPSSPNRDKGADLSALMKLGAN